MVRSWFLFFLVWLSTPLLADVAGVIRVKDGDTIEMSGITIRLHGIDAPESNQMCGGQGAPVWPCGAWVSGEVRARFNGQHARCEEIDMDRYGRVVARCMVLGQDMGRVLVQEGYAFAFRKYSMDYDLDEKSAAVNDRGLHATGVQSPAAFRASVRSTRAFNTLATAPPGCEIKGNISADGKRIYHVPGQRYYADTMIRPEQGERWFCTEIQAREAGWRRAKR